MQSKTYNKLLLFSMFFMAYWFFGNLYEEIVLAPNNLVNPFEALSHWQSYFTVSNQIYYYVPFTQLAVIVVCVLYFKTKDKTQKQFLKKASIFSLLAVGISVAIITQLNTKLFFGNNLAKYKDQLYTLSIIWLIGNTIRLYLVASSFYYIFKNHQLHQFQTSYKNN
jgi:hypothetical protein